MKDKVEAKARLAAGERIEIEIEKIVFGGEGLGRLEGFSVFVPMSVPGDIVEVEIISVKKSYARGLITKILKAGPDRIEDNGKITFEDFDGCDFGMLEYDKQLEYKEAMLKEVLLKIGEINTEGIVKEKIIESNVRTKYRNKTVEPLGKKGGKIFSGFYSRKSHNIFTAKESLLKSEVAEKVIDRFLGEVNALSGTKNELKVYNEVNGTGFLKHIMVRNNERDEALLAVVVNKKSQYGLLAKILEKLYNEMDEIKSVYISVKKEANNVVLGEETVHLCGSEYIEEEIRGIKFKVYPESFFQINREQAVKLYEKAIEYLGNEEDGTIIDAFSGTGTIGMILSQKVRKVIAIESVETSVNAGKSTADENGIENIEFIKGKVEKELPAILKKEKVSGIVFDPPRRGIDEKILRSVIKNRIGKIVYISCNPATFARDVKILSENGYILERLGAVDMFPQTHHVECIGLIQRVK